MKILLISTFIFLSGCTSLTPLAQNSDTTWVALQMHFLGFGFGEVYYCRLEKHADMNNPSVTPNPTCYESRMRGEGGR